MTDAGLIVLTLVHLAVPRRAPAGARARGGGRIHRDLRRHAARDGDRARSQGPLQAGAGRRDQELHRRRPALRGARRRPRSCSTPRETTPEALADRVIAELEARGHDRAALTSNARLLESMRRFAALHCAASAKTRFDGVAMRRRRGARELAARLQGELHESHRIRRPRAGGLACWARPPFRPRPWSIARKAARRISTPAINTTGTSFDAARPVYNRLTEFKRGTTEVVPGLAESWEISRRRQDHHLPSAQGREVPLGEGLQADARLQRRRRAVLVQPAMEAGQSLLQGVRRQIRLFQRHGHAVAARFDREEGRLHGRHEAEDAERRHPRQSGDGFRRRSPRPNTPTSC